MLMLRACVSRSRVSCIAYSLVSLAKCAIRRKRIPTFPSRVRVHDFLAIFLFLRSYVPVGYNYELIQCFLHLPVLVASNDRL